jgi:chromosomal replication initiator protein
LTPPPRWRNEEGVTPDPSLTFASFVPTAGSRRARGTCHALATRRAVPASPVLLCGPVASGKTHLLHAVANELRLASRVVCLTTAEEWRTDLVAALSRPGGAARFHERHAALDALLVDDLHMLPGLVATQQELARYLASLALRGCPT